MFDSVRYLTYSTKIGIVPKIRNNVLKIGFKSAFAFIIWQSLLNLKYWSSPSSRARVAATTES